MEALKKQVEYYLSDDNLKTDKFFHRLISENSEGWIEIVNILACNRIKKITNSALDIVECLKTSTTVVVNATSNSIRRTNTTLPTLGGKAKPTAPQGEKKDKNRATNKGFTLGGIECRNLKAVKKQVGQILLAKKNRRPEGIIRSCDFNLVAALLREHPDAAVKMSGMTGLRVDTYQSGKPKCFLILKGETEPVEQICVDQSLAILGRRLIEVDVARLNVDCE